MTPNPLIDKLRLNARHSILQAIHCIESDSLKIAFVVDDERRLIGVVTDGDVRRYLLNGGQPSQLVSACMNRQFHAVRVDTPRVELLKTFDLGYGVLPVLDAQGTLVDLCSRQMAASPEEPVLARARAPVRMSFSGGGSDLTYFFIDNPAAVLSCTVDIYARATLAPRHDRQIIIHAEDLGQKEHHESLGALQETANKSLLATIVSVIRPEFGFDLSIFADFPVGSGLGGSSAVTTAVIAAFNELRRDRWNTYEIAELAFQAERLCFGIAGGWQDQYASAFGGFNLIVFENQRNLVHPIRLEDAIRNELEACLLLCNTCTAHDSGKLHEQQRKEMKAESQTDLLAASVALCHRMHHYLIRGELRRFGQGMDEAWQLKRRFSPGVSNDRLDGIYAAAVQAGALGGKLLGAGGGGFFVFYVPPGQRKSVAHAVRALGCQTQSFRFDFSGVTSWRAKMQ
ncbi:MAG TPA: CBS domain-containing protein [Steroidobacteraceae bacterium]|nr:CBS domain-containing protein [Steroidobacteraceae bacterium]